MTAKGRQDSMTMRTSFERFFATAEPLLRRALVSAFGPEVGADASSEALSYGWAHWERLSALDNPRGYLYRVGEHWAIRQRKQENFPPQPLPEPVGESNFEPGLVEGLNMLTTRQRQAVVLVHGFGYTYAETAELLGLGRSSVQSYVERGVTGLRLHLGVAQ